MLNSEDVERGKTLAASGKYAPDSDDPAPSFLNGIVTAAHLDTLTFPPLEEHVPGLVCEGFGVIVGPPKIGKSWWVGNVGLACASGGVALGQLHVKRRPVLYLALEDGHRRLQSRLRILSEGQPLPAGLELLTSIQAGTVIATMTEWLDRHRYASPLIVLDTLGKARPQRHSGDDPYIADYQTGSRLKQLVDDIPGSGLLAVHHTRKAVSEDFIDAVSGTQGIAGSADYVLVLSRRRKSKDAVLSVTGRDVTEAEYAMVVDGGRWSIDGDDLAIAAANVETREQHKKLGDRALEVVALVNRRSETRAADLAEINVDQEQARVYLNRLADSGRITKTGRGVYKSVTSVISVTNSPNVTNETDITPKCRDCDQELSTNNQTGQCSECRFIARQQAVANQLTNLEDPNGDTSA